MIKNILLLEDDEDVAFIVKYYLEKEKININIVSEISDALTLLKVKDKLPDLVLFDLFVGNDYGGDFVDEVEKDSELPDLPLILITGSKNSEKIDSITSKKNVIGMIEKPFSSNYLFKQIKLLYSQYGEK